MTRPSHLRVVDTETGQVHEAPGECAHCAEAMAEAETWEQEVLKLKRQVKRLMEDRDQKMRNDKDFPMARELFEEWQRETGHPRARFDRNRIALALTTVKAYREDREKLSWVIQFGRHLAFVDERGHKHDSFGLLFRDAEHIEGYATKWWRYGKRGRV